MKLSLTFLMAIMTSLFYFHGVAQTEDDAFAKLEKLLKYRPFSLAIINLNLPSKEETERFQKIVEDTEGFKNANGLTFSDIVNILKSVEIEAAKVGMNDKKKMVRYQGYEKALNEIKISKKIEIDPGVLKVLHVLGRDGFGAMKKEEYEKFIEGCKNEKLIESNTTTTTTIATTAPKYSPGRQEKVGEGNKTR